jgi:nucleoside-diphosphate-sugar epimerase
MVHGDVTVPGDVEKAIRGCDIVFHCVYGNRGSEDERRLVTVGGTENVLAAALHAGVERVVHLSTLMVYGRDTPDGDLDETAPRCYSGSIYSDAKLDAEKLAFRYVEDHGLPVVVLQPTAVYGPFGGFWTTHTLKRLKTETVILVNGGDGICNAVYIDDAITFMLLAATEEQAVGQAFLVSDGQPVTWQEFFARYAQMLGSADIVSFSAAELLEAHNARKRRKSRRILGETMSILREEPVIRQRLLRTSEAKAVRNLTRLLVPGGVRQSLKMQLKGRHSANRSGCAPEGGQTVPWMSPLEVQFYALKTRVRIDKGQRLLGYQPAFDLESGMQLTEQWARWANLL